MQDRFIGCLLGLAIGDALGAPIEFMGIEEIKQRHGRVTDYLGGRLVEPEAWRVQR